MPAAGKGKDKEPKIRRKPGRVPTSCAECRRLKLRCDRNVPCEKCVSRGCGSICPDGALTSGKGNRMILANTEELHDRIDQLTSRVRDLESALQILQTQVSDEPHPLLQKDTFQSLNLPQASSRPSTTSSNDPSQTPATASKVLSPAVSTSMQMDDPTTVTESSGALAISENGQSLFFGSTARSEFLTYKSANLEMKPSRLSHELFEFACQEYGSLEKRLCKEIFRFLPPALEASRLCERYLANGKVMYSPIPQLELMDEICMTIYRAESPSDLRHPETLALLFIIFAIATHFDPSNQAAKRDSSENYYLAKACLRLFSRRENTLIYLQTLIHMVQYLDFCGTESMAPETQLELVSQATRIGYKMGLHRHGVRWNLSDDLAQRRSRIFCELFLLDTWTSFYSGRPPNISLAFVDRTTPKDYDEGIGADGNRKPGFHMWTYKYAILLHSVVATAFGPKPPTYQTVLDLDLKIRNFPVPVNWRPICEQEVPSPPPEISMIRFMVILAKECTLLSLHRSYFIQALEASPEDLSKHPFIPSVLAIYRSAWRLMRGLHFAWRLLPELISKVTTAWSQAFSAAVVMCLFVTRIPGSHLIDPALGELDRVIELFGKAASACRAASSLLHDLRSLRRLARASAGRAYEDEGYPLSSSDLDRLSGRTQLHTLPGSKSSAPTSFASSSNTTLQHSQHHSPSHLGLSMKDPSPSRATSVTLSDLPVNSPFALSVPLPMTSSLHPPSTLPIHTAHSISQPATHTSHQHIQSQSHQHRLPHAHTHHSYGHGHGHTHVHSPPTSPNVVQTSPPPPSTAIPAPTHALHPTILQDIRDFTMRGPPASSSLIHYFDFPSPEDDIPMSGTNSNTGGSRPSTSTTGSGGHGHGTTHHQHQAHGQETDYLYFQSLESSFQLDYVPQPRSPFSAMYGMGGSGVPVLDSAYQNLVEQLGFHS